MIFVDTNYFLRLLLKDENKQHQESKRPFKKAALGEVKLFTSVIVLFEIYWVLASFYQKNHSEIVKVLENVLKMDFVKFEQKKLLIESIELFKKGDLELEDCFNLAYARQKKAKGFKTFDRKLARAFDLR